MEVETRGEWSGVGVVGVESELELEQGGVGVGVVVLGGMGVGDEAELGLEQGGVGVGGGGGVGVEMGLNLEDLNGREIKVEGRLASEDGGQSGAWQGVERGAS